MTSRKEDWRRAISEDFLESSAAAFAAPYLAGTPGDAGDATGSIVGRFRLLEEIGRGGMGTVWAAERADGQFHQRVALKLIKRGMDSDEILARFLRERQILARLDHRDIARLLDGGVSEDGRPYFVMELVQGVPITRFCDDGKLPVPKRVELMIAVCRAVQYAHRSLVIHRDIKPSNVLVTESGDVKLLDFGVAKLLGEGSEDATPVAGLMTPEYASPEQLAGTPVTTASDVYQLGTLLYELLTGRRPFDGTGPGAREGDPPHPSTAAGRTGKLVRRDGTSEGIAPAVVAANRSTTPDRLRRALRGDLDAIVLRALERETDRRFPSADALADDLDRQRTTLPIRSRPAGWRYRAAKFVRRNRLRVLAAVALVAVSGVIGSIYMINMRAERDRARREAAKVAESAALLNRFFQGWSPDAADRGQVTAERVLADAAQRAERELEADPEMLATMWSILGDLYASIGKLESADSLLTRALAMQETTGAAGSIDFAATLHRRGRLLVLRTLYPEGEAVLRRALEIYRSVLPPDRMEILRVQFDLASALFPQEKTLESEALLRDALRHSPNLDAPLATEIASQLGYVMFRQARYTESAALLRTTLAQQRRIFGRLHHSTMQTMRELASALRSRKDLPEAKALDLDVLDISRTLYGADHAETATSMFSLGIVLERAGEFEEAERMLRNALRLHEQHLGIGSLTVALERRTLGGIRLVRGDLRESNLLLRTALANIQAVSPGNADEGDVRNRIAYLAFVRGDPDSLEVYREAVAFELARKPDDPFFTTDGYEYLAWAARHRGDLDLAERLYRRAAQLYDVELPDGHPYRAQSDVGLGQTLLKLGRAPEGEKYLRDGLAQWQATRPPQPPRVMEARALLERARRSGR